MFFVVGRRVPFTMKGFENRCEIYDEGSFMAQRGLWHRMGSISVAVPHGENKWHDEIGKDKVLYKEDKGVHCIRRSGRKRKCAEQNQAL